MGPVITEQRVKEIVQITKLFKKFWMKHSALRFGQALCALGGESIQSKDLFHISDAVWEHTLKEQTRVVRAHKTVEYLGVSRRMEFKLFSDGLIELSAEGQLDSEQAGEMIRFMSQNVEKLGEYNEGYKYTTRCGKCMSSYITDDPQANWCGCRLVKTEN